MSQTLSQTLDNPLSLLADMAVEIDEPKLDISKSFNLSDIQPQAKEEPNITKTGAEHEKDSDFQHQESNSQSSEIIPLKKRKFITSPLITPPSYLIKPKIIEEAKSSFRSQPMTTSSCPNANLNSPNLKIQHVERLKIEKTSSPTPKSKIIRNKRKGDDKQQNEKTEDVNAEQEEGENLSEEEDNEEEELEEDNDEDNDEQEEDTSLMDEDEEEEDFESEEETPETPKKRKKSKRNKKKTSSTSTSSSSSRSKTGHKRLPKDAVIVLKKWFDEHADKPYPSTKTKQILGKQTNLGVDQISQWFSNRRRRNWESYKPKHKKKIMRMRLQQMEQEKVGQGEKEKDESDDASSSSSSPSNSPKTSANKTNPKSHKASTEPNIDSLAALFPPAISTRSFDKKLKSITQESPGQVEASVPSSITTTSYGGQESSHVANEQKENEKTKENENVSEKEMKIEVGKQNNNHKNNIGNGKKVRTPKTPSSPRTSTPISRKRKRTQESSSEFGEKNPTTATEQIPSPPRIPSNLIGSTTATEHIPPPPRMSHSSSSCSWDVPPSEISITNPVTTATPPPVPIQPTPIWNKDKEMLYPFYYSPFQQSQQTPSFSGGFGLPPPPPIFNFGPTLPNLLNTPPTHGNGNFSKPAATFAGRGTGFGKNDPNAPATPLKTSNSNAVSRIQTPTTPQEQNLQNKSQGIPMFGVPDLYKPQKQLEKNDINNNVMEKEPFASIGCLDQDSSGGVAPKGT